MRRPDFSNLLSILNRKKPERATLFEFFLNEKLHEEVTGIQITTGSAEEFIMRRVRAFEALGFDYATVQLDFKFPDAQELNRGKSAPAESAVSDISSFKQYPWPEPDNFNYSILEEMTPRIPEGMKLIVCGPGGVLENAVKLVGYDNLCFMSVDNPDLLHKIFEQIGSRLAEYYKLAGRYSIVGAMISNDDWGFKTQTRLSPDSLREYVFPWHCRIVEAIHNAGKPAILHSCGYLEPVMDDIINVMKYDAKHSFEDNIYPVEQAYKELNGQIGILGGIDMDFLCRKTPEEIYRRSKNMLELSSSKGGYALGSGNSIPEYIKYENFKAMTDAALGTSR